MNYIHLCAKVEISTVCSIVHRLVVSVSVNTAYLAYVGNLQTRQLQLPTYLGR